MGGLQKDVALANYHLSNAEMKRVNTQKYIGIFITGDLRAQTRFHMCFPTAGLRSHLKDHRGISFCQKGYKNVQLSSPGRLNCLLLV